jgi:5-methylcytosine-specific restriction endonuclease McrA
MRVKTKDWPSYIKQYHSSHREQRREACKKWKLKNPDKCREHVKRRYENDPEYFRLKQSAKYHNCLPALLKQILERDRCCQNCWIHEDLTFDHIIPISKGGKTEYDNMQILCRSCNSSKGNKL